MKKEFFENKIEGFSRLSKKEKIDWIKSNYFGNQSIFSFLLNLENPSILFSINSFFIIQR